MDAAKLKDIELFQGLSSKQRDQLSPWLDEIDMNAGRELVTQDTLGHEFFVVLDGTCEVHDGSTHLADIGAGDFFGEIALLETDRRVATVTATSPVRLAVMSRADFRAMQSRFPDIAQRLHDAIAARNTNRATRTQ
jgi:CRP-like cAMP-binding protein